LDLARIETELASAETDFARLMRTRAVRESTLAVLTGTPAPAFTLAEQKDAPASWPKVPAGLPSELLERRPDVAMAERALAAANARIGVAKASFFPVVRLTGSAGFVSAELDSLFNWDSRVWSLGPSVSLPLFSGGRNRANLARARAAFDEAAAEYRQRVLVAFADVQESLTALRFITDETSAITRLEAAAQRTADLARARYEGGIVSYLEVIEAQRSLLDAKLDAATAIGLGQTTTVQLIKALGGGWTETAPVPTVSVTSN
jgi:multidrug efflux system outer membrane protein